MRDSAAVQRLYDTSISVTGVLVSTMETVREHSLVFFAALIMKTRMCGDVPTHLKPPFSSTRRFERVI
jgi:hypothetical protein